MTRVEVLQVRKWIRGVRDAGCRCGALPPEERGQCAACLTAAGALRVFPLPRTPYQRLIYQRPIEDLELSVRAMVALRKVTPPIRTVWDLARAGTHRQVPRRVSKEIHGILQEILP